MLHYFYKNKKLLFISVLIIKGISIFLATSISFILSEIINIITDINNLQEIKKLVNIFIFSIAFTFGLGTFQFLEKYLTSKLIKKIMKDIRKNTLKGLFNNGIAEYKDKDTGYYISLFNNNISKIEDSYFKNMLDLYTSILKIVFAISMLIWINPIMAVIATFIMLIPTLIPKIFSKKLSKSNENVIKEYEVYNNSIKEIFDGFEVIKNYNLINIIVKKNQNNIISLENKKFINEKISSELYVASNCVSICCQFSLMFISGYFCLLNIISIGEIIAITQLSGEVISPLTTVANKFTEIKGIKSICKDLIQIINKKEENNIKNTKNDIILKNVSFLCNEKHILKDFSYSFEMGKIYAIIGKTGSGKSTILKLIMKYYNTYTGEVYSNIDNISYLQQDSFLFNDSIKNNICMFKNIEDSTLNDVIKKCKINNIIYKLKNGINHIVGENGKNLSGGEKQRICIARALASNKKILITDEATSALDNYTAHYVENNILDIKDILYITVMHRLKKDTLKKFDKILIIEDGKLVGDGTFEELSSNIYFKRIYKN